MTPIRGFSYNAVMARDDAWMREAACRNVPDPDVFFPRGAKAQRNKVPATAKMLCQACPVRKECLAYAIAHGVGTGIWGGLSSRDRRRRFSVRDRERIRIVWFTRNPSTEPLKGVSYYVRGKHARDRR